MGFLNKMFGGGTEVTVRLDHSQAPAGGMASGRVVVEGGKDDLQIVAVHVRLIHILIGLQEGSSPLIEPRLLADHPLTRDQALPAGSTLELPFALPLPGDAEPSTSTSGYQVVAIAGIPGVKDPTARAELKVVETAAEPEAPTIDDGPPLLVREHVRHPDVELRRALAQTLREAAEDRLPDKKALLLAMAHDGDAEVRSVVFAAMGDYREDPHVTRLSVDAVDHDPSPAVKAAAVATLCLGHDHERAATTLEVYERHATSPHPQVRTAIARHVDALPRDEHSRVQGIVQQLRADPDPSVRQALARALRDLEGWPSGAAPDEDR